MTSNTIYKHCFSLIINKTANKNERTNEYMKSEIENMLHLIKIDKIIDNLKASCLYISTTSIIVLVFLFSTCLKRFLTLYFL